MASGMLAVGAFLALLAGTDAPARDGCSDGCYRIGLSAAVASPGGDLDGKSAVTSDSFAVAVPKLALGRGLNALLGIRHGGAAWEVRYERTSHRATLPGGGRQDAVLQVFILDARWYPRRAAGLRPFMAIGWIPYVQLDVERGGATAAGSGSGHLRRMLKAMDLSGGVEVPLGRFLVLEAMGGWHLMALDEVRGPSMSWSYFDGLVKASGPYAQLGLVLEL